MNRRLISSLALLAVVSATGALAQKSSPKITRAAAEKIALAKESGTIKSGELEKEHGRLIYSFDIATASGIREVNLDAKTGEVVEDSVESAADEAKEKKEDAAKPKN